MQIQKWEPKPDDDPREHTDIGIWEGVPFDVYNLWPGLRKSRLWTAKTKTPAHYRWELDQPDEDTQALLVGRAAHAAVLEPELFAQLYQAPPPPPEGAVKWDRRLKAHKAAWAMWKEAIEDGGYVEITQDDYELACNLRDAVNGNKTARMLLEGAKTELSIQWINEPTGLLCKARADAMKGGVLMDFKTCRCANVDPFGRDAYKYGYHAQGAMYFDGASAVCDHEITRFILIAVEKEPPYLVKCYELEGDAMDIGRADYHIALQLVQYAMKLETEGVPRAEAWAGYGNDISPLMLPPWAGTELQG